MIKIDWDNFKDGYASGSMRCRKCSNIFRNVRFGYSCHDKVDGNWPKCCGELAVFCDDWQPEVDLSEQA